MDANPNTTPDPAKPDAFKGHTATPWTFDVLDGWGIYAGGGTRAVASVMYSDDFPCVDQDEVAKVDAEGEANGALIVAAVNARARLIGTLEKLRSDMIYTAPELMAFKAEEKWMPMIEEALAEARGA